MQNRRVSFRILVALMACTSLLTICAIAFPNTWASAASLFAPLQGILATKPRTQQLEVGEPENDISTTAVLFNQDFSSSTVVADFVSANPDSGQFNAIGSSGGGTTVSINSGALQFTRAASNVGSFSRTADFTPTPDALIYKFDLSVASTTSQTSAAIFYVGSNFDTTNNTVVNANVFGRFGVNFSTTNGNFALRDITGGTNSAEFSGTQTITWTLNNSGAGLNYTAPDASLESIANDRADVWIGTTKVFDDVLVTTSTQVLTDIKFAFTQGSGTIRIDNMVIQDMAAGSPVMTTSPGNLPFGNVNVGATSSAQPFTITNNGTASLTFSAELGGTDASSFILAVDNSTPIGAGGNRQGTVQCAPTSTGAKSATLTISGNDPANPSDVITLSCTGVGPEMNVQGNGQNIADGDVTPSLTDHTDFGSALVSGGTVVRTFTIQNTGTASLNLTGTPRVAVSGANASDFTVTIQPSSPVAAGGSTTFQVTFDPSVDGLRTATLSIAHDDADENPYSFSIQGIGAVPEIGVSPLDINFGGIPVGQSSASINVTVSNSGIGNLNFTRSIVGTNPGDFSAPPSPPVSLAPGNNVTIPVTFTPTTIGIRSAILRISSDDSDEPIVDVQLTGTGSQNSLILVSPAAPVNFGSTGTGQSTGGLTFTLQNAGTSTITLGNPLLGSGTEFLLAFGLSDASLFPGETATVGVRFLPTALGLRTDTLSIQGSGDPTPLVISLYGIGTPAPNITVNSNHLPFGSVTVGNSSPPFLMEIGNNGSADLHVGSVVSGNPDFTIQNSPANTTIAPGGSAQFSVTFSPTTATSYNTNLTISSDDPDAASTFVQLTGTGTVPSLATDHFQSTIAGFNQDWEEVSNWESSPDGLNWVPATLTPNSDSSSITILAGHEIRVNANVTVDDMTIEPGGFLEIEEGATLTVNNGFLTDLLVSSPAVLRVRGTLANGGSVEIQGELQMIGASANVTGNPLEYDTFFGLARLRYGMSSGTTNDVVFPETNVPRELIVFGDITLHEPRTVPIAVELGSGTFDISAGLTLANNITIRRGDGGFAGSPTFGADVNVSYVNSTPISTGTEIPASGVLRSLAFGGNGVTLTSDLTVNHSLSLGVATTGANTLTLGPDGVLTSNDPFNTGYVIGNFRRVLTGSCLCLYPVGTANGRLPVVIQTNIFDPGTYDQTVSAVGGPHPHIADPTKSLGRYWKISEMNGPGSVTADITFYYQDPIDIPVTATEDFLSVYRFSGGVFTNMGGILDTTFNRATITGVTSFSDWTLAEPSAVSPPPTVTTSAATAVTTSEATLNGSSNPNGSSTTGWFRYSNVDPGTCNDVFGTRAPVAGGTALGSGNTPVPYSQPITGLAPGITYYFCAIAQSSEGVSFGSVLSFTTPVPPPPTVTTSAATLVTSSEATLNGSANPNGSETTGWFRYSNVDPVTCNDVFGTRAPVAGGTALGSGNTPVPYSQPLAGLAPGTTYYFCAIAQSSEGISFGTVLSFTIPTNVNLVVDNLTDDGALSGCDTGTPDDCSLRGANSVANDGDTITFAPNLFLPEAPQTIVLGSEIAITNDITITGPGADQLTIDGGPGTNRIFQIDGGTTVSISGLTLTGGNTTGDGGAILNSGILAITNMVITGNSAGATINNGGGGIANQGTITIATSTISGNSAMGGGGGLLMVNGGTATISGSTFSGNSSSGGGAILSQSINLPGSLTITNSTISGNNGPPCSGVWILQQPGGASTATVTSTTITNNVPGNGSLCAFGPTTVRNTIVAGNLNGVTDIDVSGALFTSQGYNLIGNVGTVIAFTAIGDQAGGGANPVINPMLGPLANNGGPTFTHRPGVLFPGQDKGCAFGSTTDQRGMPRTVDWPGIANASCDGTDIGAVEILVPTAADASISGRVLSAARRGIASALVTVSDTNGNSVTTTTNTFGYYSVRDLPTGTAYFVTVTAKRFRFDPSTHIVTLNDDVSELDFVASP